VITLHSLFVYPIKSCRGIELTQAEVTPAGLHHDREWLIVTPSGRFLTQREVPQLALVVPEISLDTLTLRAPGMEPLQVSLTPPARAAVQVTIWRDHCKAHDAGREAAQWLERCLGRPARLVRFDASQPRPTDPDWSGGVAGFSQFADAFPFLVLSRASLDDLNSRLPAPLPMNRFRPNLVLDGCDAYAEDSFGAIRLGEVELRVVKPCIRCIVTTTDQGTGERDGVEPLQTLKSYRWHAALKGVAFGQNAVVASGAGSRLEVGMECRPVAAI
jgi:uncharacterized protein YcbX